MMLDFSEVKSRVTIEDAISILGLVVKPEGHQLRGHCPCSEGGGLRNLVVTPAKGVFYCFTAKKGGDCISLAAHVRGITVKEAAVLLDGKKAAEPEKKNGEESFQPLTYLDATHELVIALGFTPEVCEAVGIGFAPKGSMRGNVLIPVRLPTGHLVGYVGVQGEVTLPKEWRLK